MNALHDSAERVAALVTASNAEYLSERRTEVAAIVESCVRGIQPRVLHGSPDAFVQARFGAQTKVLDELRTHSRFVPASVRDDVDRRLALPYFLINLALLRMGVAQK
jgi:hypothetical protein